MSTFTTPKGTTLPFLNLKGKDYLQVAHRIQWFREEHPNFQIKTEIVDKTDKYVTAKATISNEAAYTLQEGHKTEHYAHFADALEKAETGAVGRALAMLGFGTQFAQELEEGQVPGQETPRIADSPLPKPIYQAAPPAPKKYQAVDEDALFNTPMPFGPTKGTLMKDLPVRDIQGAVKWCREKNKFMEWCIKAERALQILFEKENDSNIPLFDLPK